MNPWTDLSQILIEEFRRTMGMFLVWFQDSKLSGSTLKAKIYFSGKTVQVRVNGCGNF